MTTDDTAGEPLSAEELLIAELTATMSYKAAAEMVGMSKSTIQRRMRDPRIRAAREEHRTTTFRDVQRQMRCAAESAVQYLHEVIEDENRPDTIRLKASHDLLVRYAVTNDEDLDPDLIRRTSEAFNRLARLVLGDEEVDTNSVLSDPLGHVPPVPFVPVQQPERIRRTLPNSDGP